MNNFVNHINIYYTIMSFVCMLTVYIKDINIDKYIKI